jgi:PadR family transcriptional regulator, regulatory protein PadR
MSPLEKGSEKSPVWHGTLELEQEGLVTSAWSVSDNNRRAKFYRLTRAGRRQIDRDRRQSAQTAAIVTRFLTPGVERS